MIPSFSLERTQELIYELNNLVDRQHVLPRIPIFLDSPLAIKANRVYLKYPEYYETASGLADGDDTLTTSLFSPQPGNTPDIRANAINQKK